MESTGTGRLPAFLGHTALVVTLGLIGTSVVMLLFSVKPLFGLAILGAVLIPITALLSGNPRTFFLVGVVLAAPLNLCKYFAPYPHFGGEYALRIEAADLFLAVLGVHWLYRLLSGRERFVRIPRAALCWMFLILLGGLSIILRVYKTAAGYEVIRMTKNLVLFLYIANRVVRRKQIEIIVATMLGMAMVQCVYGLTQHFTGLSLGLTKLGETAEPITQQLGFETVSRVGGLMGHPNMLASYLVMVLPVAVALLFSRISFAYKVLCGAVLLLGEAALIVTLSRGGWVAFGCALLGLAVLTFAHPAVRRRALVLRVLMVTGIVVVVLLFLGPISRKFTQSDPGTVTSRWELVRIASKMIRTHPYFGVGLNASTYVFPEYDPTGIDWGTLNPPVHNIYLLVWAEQGTVGFAAFMLMLFYVIKMGAANFRLRDDLLLLINMGLLAGFCGMLVHGLVDWTLRLNNVQRVFFLHAGLIAAITYWRQRHPPQEQADPDRSAAAAARRSA